MENERPIDIGSMNSDGARNKPAKQMLLQQISVSKYGHLVQQSREELHVEQSTGFKDVQHRGILVQVNQSI